jgi:hypothetical protein
MMPKSSTPQGGVIRPVIMLTTTPESNSLREQRLHAKAGERRASPANAA